MVDVVSDLRGLILSAAEIKEQTGWADTMIEDYLTIFENAVLLANNVDFSSSQTDINTASIATNVINISANTTNILTNTTNITAILLAYLKSASFSSGALTLTDQAGTPLVVQVDPEIIVLDMASSQSVDSATMTAMNFNSSIKDSNYTHTNGTSDITVTKAGRYRIEGFTSISGTTSGYRYVGQTQTFIGGFAEARFINSGYIRATSGANQTSLIFRDTLDLSASDVISLRIARINSTAGDAVTTVNGTCIEITKIG